MISAQNVHRSYRLGSTSIEVLHGVDLEVEAGQRVFLCGPSGAGKTTLLYTLAGLERPQQGRVEIAGTDLYSMRPKRQAAFRNRHIGYVFQNFLLLPELTALENVMVPGVIGGAEVSRAAMEALDQVGLAERAQHLPSELSGGEQQRVAIARAVAHRPRVLFADEPTGNLDSRNSAEVMDRLLGLVAQHGTTLVVVTHDQGLAQRGDRRWIIEDGAIRDAD